MTKNILLLQGGLGNQIYQLFALELFSQIQNNVKIIDDETLFELDFQFKRKASYQNLIKKKYCIQKISWINLFILKIIRKLAKHGYVKPFYFDHATNDLIFSLNNTTYIWGYFQNENWFDQFEKKVINIELKKFIEEFLINERQSEAALHVRHLEVDSTVSSNFYINCLRNLPLGEKTIYISAEENSWVERYSQLYTYLMDNKYIVNSTHDLSVDIEYMAGSNYFVPAKSTLSDWVYLYRAYHRKKNIEVKIDEVSNLLRLYLGDLNYVSNS